MPGVEVEPIETLRDLVRLLRGEELVDAVLAPERAAARARPPIPDLAEVAGQPTGRLAMELAAAGGHHVLMLGPPGAGKTMLAERLPGLLAAAVRRAGAGGHGRPFDRRCAVRQRRRSCASRRFAIRITRRASRRSSAAGAAGCGPVPPAWPIAGSSSWTRRPNSRRGCWMRCASRLESGVVELARAIGRGAVPGALHAGAGGQSVSRAASPARRVVTRSAPASRGCAWPIGSGCRGRCWTGSMSGCGSSLRPAAEPARGAGGYGVHHASSRPGCAGASRGRQAAGRHAVAHDG